jgi:hypothetical protein
MLSAAANNNERALLVAADIKLLNIRYWCFVVLQILLLALCASKTNYSIRA